MQKQTSWKSPFVQVPRVMPGFIDKILGRKLADNAIIDLTNLLARRPVLKITDEDVQNIYRHYKVDLYKRFGQRLRDLYATYLEYCLADDKLSNDEIDELKKLKSLLSLKDNDIQTVHDDVAGKKYAKSFAAALEDGRLEPHEKEFLDRLEKELKLPDGLAEKISMDIRKSYLAGFVSKIQEDQRVSPDELAELDAISRSLGLELNMDAKSRATLDRMKWYWVIENGVLPALDVQLNLQKGEVCYYKAATKWNELRKGKEGILAGAPKIMKGMPYKVGGVSIARAPVEQLQAFDSGTLYITNRRILFSGLKNTMIGLDRVKAIVPFSDGVGVEREGGSAPIFDVKFNADVMAMMLVRVVNDF